MFGYLHPLGIGATTHRKKLQRPNPEIVTVRRGSKQPNVDPVYTLWTPKEVLLTYFGGPNWVLFMCRRPQTRYYLHTWRCRDYGTLFARAAERISLAVRKKNQYRIPK